MSNERLDPYQQYLRAKIHRTIKIFHMNRMKCQDMLECIMLDYPLGMFMTHSFKSMVLDDDSRSEGSHTKQPSECAVALWLSCFMQLRN